MVVVRSYIKGLIEEVVAGEAEVAEVLIRLATVVKEHMPVGLHNVIIETSLQPDRLRLVSIVLRRKRPNPGAMMQAHGRHREHCLPDQAKIHGRQKLLRRRRRAVIPFGDKDKLRHPGGPAMPGRAHKTLSTAVCQDLVLLYKPKSRKPRGEVQVLSSIRKRLRGGKTKLHL